MWQEKPTYTAVVQWKNGALLTRWLLVRVQSVVRTRPLGVVVTRSVEAQETSVRFWERTLRL